MDEDSKIVAALPFGRITRHHEDAKIGEILRHLQRERNAVHHRHDNIRQQKIERLSALQRVQRVRTVADSDDFMPVMDQRAADEFPKRGLIFSDQYTRHSCLRSAPDNVAYIGQFTEIMRIIEAVANNKEIRAVETDEIGF